MAKPLAAKYNVPAYKEATKPQLFDQVLLLEEASLHTDAILKEAQEQMTEAKKSAEEALTQMESTQQDCIEAAKLMTNLESQIVTVRTELDQSHEQLILAQEEIDLLKETVDEYEADRPEIIPFFGADKRSFQSSLALSFAEVTKEWNILGRQLRNLGNEYGPRVLAFIDSILKSFTALQKRVNSMVQN